MLDVTFKTGGIVVGPTKLENKCGEYDRLQTLKIDRKFLMVIPKYLEWKKATGKKSQRRRKMMLKHQLK